MVYIRRHAYCDTAYIMEIRIDITSEGPETIVRVAGRLSGVMVAQFRKTCDPIEGAFVVDLSNLLFADEAGIDAGDASIMDYNEDFDARVEDLDAGDISMEGTDAMEVSGMEEMVDTESSKSWFDGIFEDGGIDFDIGDW